MTEFGYAAVAAKMREQNPYPSVGMTPGEYHSAQAIYALIRAMEALAPQQKSLEM